MRNKTYLVIGAGLMGRAIALDLSRSAETDTVFMTDKDEEKARSVAVSLPSGRGRIVSLDTSSTEAVVDAMQRADCTVGAASYTMNEHLTRCAITAGRPFLDLGGNSSVVESQKAMDQAARQKGVLIVPNCGLAPGMALVLAAGGAQEFDEVDSIRIRVGGLPRHPRPPLNYQKVFAIEGLINEYSGESEVIEHGAVVRREALTGLEKLSFPAPFGDLEAFHTSGGTSMLPRMFEGKVRHLDYKTIRYPGHCERMRILFEVGFASLDPVQLGAHVFTERELFLQLLERKLPSGGPDVVLIRVDVSGIRKGHKMLLRLQSVDYGSESDNISAMMRTTGYPTSWIAQMITRSTIEHTGVLTPEECVPLVPFMEGLATRGIQVDRSETPLA